ncbi:MAG: DUF6287 domain-containing protein [Lactobacillaceae bacterium]|jgi:hypothetical protein|nr:DUF6287 domain-containing protein [Lactobacillaceae bacterium]
MFTRITKVVIAVIVGLVVVAVGVTVIFSQGQSAKSHHKQVSASQHSSDKPNNANMAGKYYTTSGDIATLKKTDDHWIIYYSTPDGNETATFKTKWVKTNKHVQSKTPMDKSDGYSGFNVIVDYFKPTKIEITMTDGDVDHEMVFTKQKQTSYDVVLQGDLTPFMGQFSDDDFNKTVAQSGFTYGGYEPEDFYNNMTTLFPTIKKHGFWSGGIHANFEIKASDMPTKIDGYYKVNVYGTNSVANNAEQTFYLVPPKVKGPDGKISNEKRVFEKYADGEKHQLIYQKANWWKKYQSKDLDLDISAINNGDFTTIVGTWKNGNNQTLVIQADGTTTMMSDGAGTLAKINAVKDSDKTSKVPYAALTPIVSKSVVGAPGIGALGLFKIGFRNPDGDQSDATRPRLIVTQQSEDYPAKYYYYRVN